WKRRPEGSTWGDFGPDDQLGQLNLLTPEKVKQGVAEVREGISFCLSLPLDYPGGSVLNPRRHPPVLRPTLRSKQPNMNYRLALDDPNFTDVVSDDLASCTCSIRRSGTASPTSARGSTPMATRFRRRSITTAFAPTSTSSGPRTSRTRAASNSSRRN